MPTSKPSQQLSIDLNWMRKGVPVTYSPPYINGHKRQEVYTGRIGCKPFLMGNPKNNRWVVHLDDMSENYVKMFGRTVHTCASIEHIKPTDERIIS